MAIQLAEPEGTPGVSDEPVIGSPDDQAASTGTEQSQAAADQSQSEQAFYDAKLVPEALRPSFERMQAAWTKKTQEAAGHLQPYRDFEGKYGKLQEVQGILDQLRDPQGVLNWWVQVGQQMGASQEQLTALFNQLGGAPQGQATATQSATQTLGQPNPSAPAQNPADPNRTVTYAEIQQMLQAQRAEAEQQYRAAEEDREVSGALESLKVPDEAKFFVLAQAKLQPEHLSLTERITRGKAEYDKHVDSIVAARTSASQQASGGAPRGLGGGMPTGPQSRPALKTFAQASEAAAAFLKSQGQGN